MIATPMRSIFFGALLVTSLSVISATQVLAIDIIIQKTEREANLKHSIRRLVSFVEQSAMAIALYGATSAAENYFVERRGSLLADIIGLLVAYTITGDVNAMIAQYNGTPEYSIPHLLGLISFCKDNDFQSMHG